MRLFLIRHHKTQSNASAQIMGWSDSPAVAESAEDLAFIEQALQAHDARPERICCSALDRARRTAAYFAARFGVRPVDSAEQLNEVNYGELSAKSKKWVAAQYPRHKRDPDFVYPGGESFRQMQRRSVDYVYSLADDASGQTILCVVHAGVIRGLLSHFLELDFADRLKQKVCHRYIGVLDFEGRRLQAYDEWGHPTDFRGEWDRVLP